MDEETEEEAKDEGEGYPEKEEATRTYFSARFYAILLLLWVAWATVLLVIFSPSIKDAIKESGVEELLESRVESTASAAQREVSASLMTEEGFKKFEFLTSRRGSDIYHDTVEALISDRLDEQSKDGAFSLVSPKTKLLGLTVSEGMCYVDLSPDFLLSKSYGEYTAEDEIRESLLLYEPIEEVKILINGLSLN